MSNKTDHGCTSLRYYGPRGWRCIECFEQYEVKPVDSPTGVAHD